MRYWRQLLIILSLLAISYYFAHSIIKTAFQSIVQESIYSYNGVFDEIKDLLNSYTNQSQQIKELKASNENLSKQALTYYENIHAIKEDGLVSNFKPNFTQNNIYSATVQGYSSLPNMYRVWLQIDTNTTNNALGLVFPLPNKIDSIACGIASKRDNAWEGYLNGDSKCSYAVFVGANKTPGILYGRSNNYIVAKYIPAWVQIKVGDEVITSGVDRLFFEGVKVGIVKAVNNDNTYTEAIIEPYCNTFAPSRYYAINKNE